VGAPMRLEQRRECEGLRGLHQAKLRPVDGPGHAALPIDSLHRIRNREHRYGRTASARRRNAARDQGGGSEWPRRIVHEDQIWPAWPKRLETCAHRSLPGRPAQRRLEQTKAGGGSAEQRAIVAVDDRLYHGNARMTRKRLQASADNGLAPDLPILLGSITAGAHATPGGNHNGRNQAIHVLGSKCCSFRQLSLCAIAWN
jgi:hypothetical protein